MIAKLFVDLIALFVISFYNNHSFVLFATFLSKIFDDYLRRIIVVSVVEQ